MKGKRFFCLLVLFFLTVICLPDNCNVTDETDITEVKEAKVEEQKIDSDVDSLNNSEAYTVQPLLIRKRNTIAISRGYRMIVIEGLAQEVEKEVEKEKEETKQEYPIPEGLSPIPEYENYIDERIDFYSEQFGVDADIIRGMVMKESTFDPVVRNGAGYGLMQLEPMCCKEMGVSYPCTNIDANLRAGIGYFKRQLDEFGDVRLALAAYNWGPGNIQKTINSYGADYEAIEGKMPQAVKEHVEKVLGYCMVFRGK